MMEPKTFGKNIQSATGVSLAALFIILATNGKEFIEAVAAFPQLVLAFSGNLPLGFWSGAIGTVLAAGFHIFVRSWHTRTFAIEIATIMVGLTVVMVQQGGGTVPQVLSALVVGLVVGLGGLFTGKLFNSIFGGRNECAKPKSN